MCFSGHLILQLGWEQSLGLARTTIDFKRVAIQDPGVRIKMQPQASEVESNFST
jgi:hypothetical protein